MEFPQFITPSKPNSHYLAPRIFSLKRGFPMGVPIVDEVPERIDIMSKVISLDRHMFP
jgi:hypothetical protein